MVTIRVRDQYGVEHEINEGQRAYEPWRSCEVVPDEGGHPQADEAPKSVPDRPDIKPIKKAGPRPASEDKE